MANLYEIEQSKALNILHLVPDIPNTFFTNKALSGKKGSDLGFILYLAKNTLREAHPVFGMCLQVYFKFDRNFNQPARNTQKPTINTL